MNKHKKSLQEIAGIIKSSQKFFIAGHLKPDGDTIGTALALKSLLARMGKEPHVFSKEPVPSNMLFLPGARDIKIRDKVTGVFDCAIILESVSLERMGSLIELSQADKVINIDHHATFTNFGHVNYIDSTASSSAEQLYIIFKQLNKKPTAAEAECLYAGLVTDTGKFQHSNASPSALAMASELIKAGVKPFRLYDRIYANKTPCSLRLLGLALNSLKISKGGQIACMRITRQMFKNAGASVNDTEEIINYCMMMPEIKIGVLSRENPGGARNDIKISLRSRGFDVSEFARHYGGGGHRNASGFSLKGNIASVEEKIIAKLSKAVEK